MAKLTEREKAEAINLAEGMRLAQDGRSATIANMMDNPHFSNISHAVKLEALRIYASENKGAILKEVPTSSESTKNVLGSAMKQGLISLPASVILGLTGSSILDASTGMDTNSLESIYKRKSTSNRFIKRLGPLAASVFAANAAVGGTLGYIDESAKRKRAKTLNDYFTHIDYSSPDSDINAILLGAKPSMSAIRRRQDEGKETVEAISHPFVGDKRVGLRSFQNPETNPIARLIHEEGNYARSLDKKAEAFTVATKPAPITSPTTPKVVAPVVKKDPESPAKLKGEDIEKAMRLMLTRGRPSSVIKQQLFTG